MYIFVVFVLCYASAVQSKIPSSADLQRLVLQTINETSAPDFEPCNENLLQKAVFGDMIEIKRGLGYFHWCVFEEKTTVINFNNPSFDKLNDENFRDNFPGYIERTDLFELAKKDLCRINNKLSESKRRGLHALSKDEISKDIQEELERKVTNYNVVDYNCESFAVKLRFGVAFSSQVDALQKIYEGQDDEFKQTLPIFFKLAVIAIRSKSDAI